jgi:hypothetical protein
MKQKVRMNLKLLNELMFETVAWLSDANVKGEELDRALKQAAAISKLAETAVVNGYKALAMKPRGRAKRLRLEALA